MDSVLTCPFFYIKGCQWRSKVSEMTNHFIRIHRTAYQPHPITVELVGGTIYLFVTVAFNTIFFVQIKVNLSINIECLVRCLHLYDKHEFHFYEYHIHAEHGSVTSINLLGEMQDFCYPNKMQCFQFGYEGTPSNHNTQKVKCNIEISRKRHPIQISKKYKMLLTKNLLNLKKEFEQQEDGAAHTVKLQLCEINFLEVVECPVCSNYGSIFNCESGSSICQDCSAKLKGDPICSCNVTDAKTYSIENFIKGKQNQCQFAPFGCQQIRDCQSVTQHLEECVYKPIKCPFNVCGKNIILLALSDHCARIHAALLFKEHQVLRKVLTTPSVSYNSTIFKNEIFLLRCEGDTNSVKFNCVHVNKQEIKENYEFQLKFLSKSNPNQKLVASHNCMKRFIDFENDAVVLAMQLLKPFIVKKPEPRLYFTCGIKKV